MLVAPRSGLVRAVNVAAQTFLRSISRVVGGDVIDDAIAFFQAFEGMEEGFRERADRVNQLLSNDAATAFLLVASARRDTMQEARFFADRLHDAGIPVEGLIVNRVHPRFGEGLAEATRSRATTLAGTPLGDLYANLADFQSVAAREREHLSGAVSSAPVVWVPFLGADIHDLAGLSEVAHLLFPPP
jgi:anion-transporting  ArsA/GET3 family ATPase